MNFNETATHQQNFRNITYVELNIFFTNELTYHTASSNLPKDKTCTQYLHYHTTIFGKRKN